MIALAASAASQAQARPAGGGPRITVQSHSNHFSWERGHGFRRGFFPVLVIEREVPVIVEREVVVREVPVKELGTPDRDVSQSPRKPYVIGGTYASLPRSCMKMIEGGASYYWCSGGEWYQLVGKQYRAVARP